MSKQRRHLQCFTLCTSQQQFTWDYHWINTDFIVKGATNSWMYCRFNGYLQQAPKPMFPLSSFAGPSGYTMRYYRRFVHIFTSFFHKNKVSGVPTQNCRTFQGKENASLNGCESCICQFCRTHFWCPGCLFFYFFKLHNESKNRNQVCVWFEI